MAESVTYLDYDAVGGTFTNATAECTVITRETTAFADGGWYVAKGTNFCSAIAVSGSAHLILADRAELAAAGGIGVSVGNSLAIYGQKESNGKLAVGQSGNGVSIGGLSFGESCGAITVNGGIVKTSAGIGGGDGEIGGNGGDGGRFTVNGGLVSATRIGGGAAGPSGPPQMGGTPKVGSDGKGVTAAFFGGVVEAQYGIFTDGEVTYGARPNVTGAFNTKVYIRVEVLGSLVDVLNGVEYVLPGESTALVAKNVDIVTPGRINTFTNGGWYVARGTNDCETITVEGSVNLILADGAELTVNGGIRVTAGNLLTIYGQSEDSGTLIATGAEGCAGIGGGGAGGSCGVVTLNGGIVTATGGTGAAGIGGGAGAAGMDGYTQIDSGTDGGAGGSCGVVTLNGGIVTATGGTGAAGIGGGAGGVGGNVGTVVTTAGELAWDSVRSGNGGDGGAGGTVIINAGIVTASGGTGAAGFGGGVGGIRGTGAHLSGFEGRNGSNGAGVTVTFLGGVTEAQSGIFTKGEPTLGENVEVTGKFNVLARIVVFEADAIALGHKDHPWAAGDTVTAHTNGTTLVIEGTGAMYDFEDATDVPWAAAADKLTTVTVANTVTHVGKNALAGFTDAVTVNGTPISFYDMMASARGLSEPVIPDDMVLVAQTELQAAKAEIVNVANGMVYLGVSVLSNSDITASSVNWAPVKFTPDTQIGLSADGTKLILPIPVAAQQGFMILQSGDAKVSEGEVRGLVIGEPWYKPTVED